MFAGVGCRSRRATSLYIAFIGVAPPCNKARRVVVTFPLEGFVKDLYLRPLHRAEVFFSAVLQTEAIQRTVFLFGTLLEGGLSIETRILLVNHIEEGSTLRRGPETVFVEVIFFHGMMSFFLYFTPDLALFDWRREMVAARTNPFLFLQGLHSTCLSHHCPCSLLPGQCHFVSAITGWTRALFILLGKPMPQASERCPQIASIRMLFGEDALVALEEATLGRGELGRGSRGGGTEGQSFGSFLAELGGFEDGV